MWTMASPYVTSQFSNVVVTHGVPSIPSAQHLPSQQSLRFRKGQPKALGIVLIMIGVVALTFGLSMISYHPSFMVQTGIFAWGAVIYISAGSFTVAAETRANKCLMNASLGLNILATVASVNGMILNVVDATIWKNRYDKYYYFYPGFSIGLTIFHILAFFVSIVSAGFTCRATCCMEPQVMVHTGHGMLAPQPASYPYTAHVAPAQAPAEAQFYNQRPGPGYNLPPAYHPQF